MDIRKFSSENLSEINVSLLLEKASENRRQLCSYEATGFVK